MPLRQAGTTAVDTPTKTIKKKKSTAKKPKKCILRVLEINNTSQTTAFTFISGDSNNQYTIQYDKMTEKFSCNCGEKFKIARRSNCKHVVSIEPMKDFFAYSGNTDNLGFDELAELLKKIL